MTKDQSAKIYEAISQAVYEAIEVVGIDGIKAMSMFPSAVKGPAPKELADA